MANKKIKIQVYGEWANIKEMEEQLQATISKEKVKLSPESKGYKGELAKRQAEIETKLKAGVSEKDLAPELNDYLLVFKKFSLSLLTISQEAKTHLLHLYKTINELQNKYASLLSEKASIMKQGIYDPEKAEIYSTKKARSDIVRAAKIKNLSGGLGEFITTPNTESLGRLAKQRETWAKDETRTAEQRKQFAEDALKIRELIAQLETLDRVLTDRLKSITQEAEETKNKIEQTVALEREATEQLEFPEKQINVAADGVVTANEKVAEAVEELQEATEKSIETQQEHNKVTEEGSQEKEKQVGTIKKVVTAFFGYQMALRALRKLWSDAMHTITQLDKALTEQAIVSSLNRKETFALIGAYQELAKATGFTTSQIATVSTQYFRQGKALREVLILTEAAAKSAKVAGIDAQQAVDYLTTALNGFRLAAERALEVSDKFAALAATSATSYEELAIALSKVASQANLAGMSINYTLGLLAKGIETTREPAESIGTALKTIVARMRELTDYGATLEDGMNLNNVERQLSYINIELRDQQGQLRSTEAVLDELGKKWEILTVNQQASIAKALAGSRQQARLIAMMTDYQRTLELVQISEDSLGATNAQQMEYLRSLEAAQNRLKTSYEAFITALTQNEAIIWIVNTLADILGKVAALLNTKDEQSGWGGWAALIGIAAGLLGLMLPKLIEMGKHVQNIVHDLRNSEIIQKNKLLQIQKQNAALREQQLILEQMNQLELMRTMKPGSAEYKAAQTNYDSLTGKIEIQQELQKQKELDPKTLKNSQFAQQAQGIMMAIAGISMLIAAIAETIKMLKNAAKDAAQDVVDKNKEVQAQIYENTQVIRSVEKLRSSFDTLNSKVVKTSEDLEAMAEIRKQLLDQFTKEEQQSMEYMSNAQLMQAAEERASEKKLENDKKLLEMEENIREAQGKTDFWGNINKYTSGGALTGAGIGGAVGAAAGGVGMVPGAVAGGVAGAAVGFWTGVGISIAEKAVKSNSAKNIKELLKSEEGLAQARFLYSEQIKKYINVYDDDAMRVIGLYQSLLQTLDAAEMEKIMLEMGMTAEQFADHMYEVLSKQANSLETLSSPTATYSEQIEALHKLLKDSSIPDEFKDGLRDMYAGLINLEKTFTTSIDIIDDYSWTIDQLNKFATALKAEDLDPDAWIKNIDAVLSSGGSIDEMLGEFGDTLKGTSYKVKNAIADLVAAGRTVQDLAEDQSRAVSRIQNARDAQAKWSSMSAAEKQSFITENQDLFMTDGKWDDEKFRTFIEGRDISGLILDAMTEQQKELADGYSVMLLKLGIQLQAKEQELEEAIASGKSQTQIDTITAAIEALNSEIAITELLLDETATMFDLTLDQIIDKQQKQLNIYKDMLEKEREALVKSLEERRDAYNKYFDAINKQYQKEDYEEQKARIESQILKLSGASDAASMMKVAELQAELAALEKGRSETLWQDAQQAALDGIDAQLEEANKYYDKMLKNDELLLEQLKYEAAQADNAYALQYKQYLATSGMTQEAQEKAWKEFVALMSGGVAASAAIPFALDLPNVQAPERPESVTNYSFNINGKNINLTDTETRALNELLRAALKRAGITSLV